MGRGPRAWALAPTQGRGGQPGRSAQREHYLAEETRRLPSGGAARTRVSSGFGWEKKSLL